MRHVAQLASHPINPTGVTRETKRSPTLPPMNSHRKEGLVSPLLSATMYR